MGALGGGQVGDCPHELERLQAHGSRSMWRSLQPGLTLVLPTDRVDKSASPLLGSPSPPAAPIGSSCSSFTSHSRCTKTVSVTSTYSYPATKHNDIALCCCFFDRTEGLGLGWFFGGWALIPFLVIYLFKRKNNK